MIGWEYLGIKIHNTAEIRFSRERIKTKYKQAQKDILWGKVPTVRYKHD